MKMAELLFKTANGLSSRSDLSFLHAEREVVRLLIAFRSPLAAFHSKTAE